MKDPLFFSIIIPTYNRASFIKKTIESALNQDYKHFEILIIDDGSTDNTEEIVKSMHEPKITYYKIKNSERAAARNFGVKKAKGDYINFFDSDDILYTHHLSEAVNQIKHFNYPEIIHLSYNFIDLDGNEIHKANIFKGDIRKRMIKEGNLLSCNGVLLRKDIIENNPFNEKRDLSGSEDYELWMRLSTKYNINYSNKITSSIINHDERSVLVMNKEKLIKRFECLNYSLINNEEFLLKFGKYRKHLISNSYSYIALHLVISGHKSKGVKYLFKSFTTLPLSIFNKRFLAIIKHIIIK